MYLALSLAWRNLLLVAADSTPKNKTFEIAQLVNNKYNTF